MSSNGKPEPVSSIVDANGALLVEGHGCALRPVLLRKDARRRRHHRRRRACFQYLASHRIDHCHPPVPSFPVTAHAPHLPFHVVVPVHVVHELVHARSQEQSCDGEEHRHIQEVIPPSDAAHCRADRLRPQTLVWTANLLRFRAQAIDEGHELRAGFASRRRDGAARVRQQREKRVPLANHGRSSHRLHFCCPATRVD